jgi:Vitamin K epoxide reductase family
MLGLLMQSIPVPSMRRMIFSQVFQLPQGRMLSYFGLIPEGHLLDVPNALLGVIFYTYMLVLSSTLPKELTLFMTAMALASSIFLAFQLTFVVRELCILCWSTHVINSSLAWNLFGQSKTATGKAKRL